MINLEIFIFIVIGMLSLDFLLTRDNLRIVKKFFLLNLSISLLLLFEKAHIAFFVSSVLSLFVFGISYVLANEEHQKESFQDTWVDIFSIVLTLIMVGIVSVVLLQNPISQNVSEILESNNLLLLNYLGKFQFALYFMLGGVFLIFYFLKIIRGQKR